MRPLALATALVLTSMTARAEAPSAQKADAFEHKLSVVLARGEKTPTGARTEFAVDEVNAYLQLRLIAKFPAGVADPSVSLIGEGRIGARAVVDLDGIRRRSSGGWLDPAAYLGGRLPVTAVGTLKTANGSGQLVLERAEVAGLPVPTSLVAELVASYTKSPDMPGGVDITAPFVLPSRIQRIDVLADRAAVVQ